MDEKRSSGPGEGAKAKTHRRSLSQPIELSVPSSSASSRHLDLHLKPVKLCNAYHDSPMFRKSLKKEEVRPAAFISAFTASNLIFRANHQCPFRC